MGKRSLPPPPSHVSLAASLGNDGIIMVLFETPSGFAIFSFDGNIWANFGRKYRAKCVVWRKEFQFFEDKSADINPVTGVSKELSAMLMKWCCPGYKLAVAKNEYKTIIEASLGIPCLCDDAMMEVMWGLKNIMHSLVPEEKSELSKEERLQMSQGLQMLLNRYGVDVKPEMVSDRIIGLACVLYDCDGNEKVHSISLHDGGNILKDVSGIDPRDWSPMKLATALKMVCYPGEEIVGGDPKEMFSDDVLLKFEEDAHKYEGKMYNAICLKIYNELLSYNEVRTVKVEQLRSSVKEAEKVYQTDKDALRSWGLDPPSKRFKSKK
ncbi:unnamed protein product [Urochloa decumbens]|uniref:Nucleolar protein 58/56 N-terminal domain-containing protein n=1 Tax=Urochloa decumbens TaxID=240449 RepID=A0ABC9CLE4_9POAL